MVLRTLSVARVKYTLVALTFVLLCLGYVFQGCELVLFSPDPQDHAMSCISRSHDIATIKSMHGHCHTGCLAVTVTTLILNNFFISRPIIKPFNSMEVETIRICLVY